VNEEAWNQPRSWGGRLIGGYPVDLKVLLTTFGMIFLAELGDKTQLATFCFAAESESKLAVFFGSASALVLTSALGCLLGSVVSRFIPPHYLNLGAGALFVILGLWMIFFSGGK
jgi:putative Ca2+/H+ antiporter (TMEM165/GDT1 family)